MEVKIKDKDGYVEADWTIEDGILMVSPKEVKFEPKDGDVVFVRACFEHIIIYRNSEESIECYLELLRGNLIPTKSSVCNRKNVLEFRPATEEEKKKLFDKLAEEGCEFDFEKKELVKLKWKPDYGVLYYRPGIRRAEIKAVSDNWADNDLDKSYYDKGWAFKTYEECDAFCNKLRQAIEGVKP